VRISRKAEYALRALVAFARQPKSWQIQELSQRENIPVKFLEQILLALRHAGFLSSKRGVGGGYVLRKAPSEITVGQVIRTLDGPLALIPCAAELPGEPCTCPDRLRCPVRIFLSGVCRDMSAILESKTIEDLTNLAPSGTELAFEI
jgi:Rrf2 family protein